MRTRRSPPPRRTYASQTPRTPSTTSRACRSPASAATARLAGSSRLRPKAASASASGVTTDHARASGGGLWYDGYEPTGPAAALFASETDHALSHSGGHDGDHAESPTPAPTQTTSTEPAAQGEVVINTVTIAES